MDPASLQIWAVLIQMCVKLGIDIYQLIKDAGFNDATTDELCAMVDESIGKLRKPGQEV